MTELYKLGWQAALHDENRRWVEQFGPEALKGYDDYWDEFGP